MKISVLFVCLGNICRSPTAQAVFVSRAKAAGLDLTIESCGTGAWHVGDPPDPRSVEAGEGKGYSFVGQSARQIESLDFARFDYILAMDQSNLKALKAMAPANYGGHLGLFLEFSTHEDQKDVPDPYYGGKYGFTDVLNLIERACEGLISQLSGQ